MTLTADSRPDLGDDRRGRAAGPRRSWASPQPFDLPGDGDHVRATAPVDGWAAVSRGFRARVLLSDVVTLTGVTSIFLVLREGPTPATVGLVAGVVALLVLLIAALRGYDPHNLGDGPAEYQVLLRAGAIAFMVTVTAAYALRVDVPRSYVLIGLPAAVGTALLGRYLHRQVLHRVRHHGRAMMRTLVVGNPHEVARVVGDLARAPHHGYQVVGVCTPSLDLDAEGVGGPVLGALADVPQVVVDRAVDVVVVAGSPLGGPALRRLSWALDRAGATLIVVPDLVEVTAPRLTVRPTAGLSLLEVEVGAPRRRLVAKSVLDRTLGTLLLLGALPVIAVAAVAVRVTSHGPAFFRQTRVGVDGETFSMWKLRSMYVDAERRRAELAVQDEGAGVLFKVRRDPRVTPVGRVLRRMSLDELPQLWNVVRGDMSLVGPRPPLLEEVEQYGDHVHRRLRVKPGLTGLWQVSGRSDLDWEESVRLDLRYVDNWSLTMDLMILWKTARAVVSGSGAY